MDRDYVSVCTGLTHEIDQCHRKIQKYQFRVQELQLRKHALLLHIERHRREMAGRPIEPSDIIGVFPK